MTRSAAEIAGDAASSSTIPAEDAMKDNNASAPRRGSRTRKPTSKAAGLDPSETTDGSRAGRKRKADDLNAVQEKVTPEIGTSVERIDDEVNKVFGREHDGAEEDEDDDEKQYCICRGKDDGTFMISCERCQEWLVLSAFRCWLRLVLVVL